MVRPFRFAVQIADLTDPASVVVSARQAEDLGYEEFYSHDHLGSVDPFLPLVVAAQATSILRVGPLVLNNEFHHPALLARTVATADRMTGGRIVLGVGTGWAQSEHDAAGIVLRPPPARVDRLAEALSVVSSLLDDGQVDMSGRHHRIAITDVGVRPLQSHVPILVGGNGRRVIEVGARLADIFQFTGISHCADGSPRFDGFSHSAIAERARLLSDAAGTRNGAIERSVLVQHAGLGAEAVTARDRVSRSLGLKPEVAESSPFLLFGPVGAVVDHLESIREALGISHVVVRDIAGFAPVVAALAGR